MVKVKLSDEQKVSFQSIHYMLCSKDEETQNLAYNLAKEELNFNIGWVFIHDYKPFFKSISQCIENISNFRR